MPAPSERRSVTVLFSDLKGFTAFSESRDPEEVQELVSALFERFRRVIEEEGGTIDKFIGDAVMAVFGAPVAHEDDPLRAVRAGLRMQEAAREIGLSRDLTLAMRVGINAGEVLWGGIAGEKATVIGDAVNVAQRLEALCAPGKVLVSREVERVTQARIQYRKLEAAPVKGRTGWIQPYEAIREVSYRPFFEERAGMRADLVGREAEMARLMEIFQQCASKKQAAYVLVEGDPGIGKSRLVYEFRQRLVDWRSPKSEVQGPRSEVQSPRSTEEPPRGKDFGLRTLDLGLAREGYGYCAREEPGSAVPFLQMWLRRTGLTLPDPEAGAIVSAAVAEDLRHVSGLDDTQRENAAHLIALSMGLEVPAARVRDLPPERRPEETALAWEKWLEGRTRGGTQPLVLVIEDVHWADATTQAMLRRWSEQVTALPLLVLVTQRPALKSAESPAAGLASGATIRRTRDAFARFLRLSLGTLERGGTERLAASLLARAPSAVLVDLLHAKTGGNPYYVQELVRHLAAAGVFEGDPVRFRESDAAQGVPETLNGLLISRIDRVGADEKQTLKVAAVIGRIFWEKLLEEARQAEVHTDLESLERAECVFPRGETGALAGEAEYVFQHALLRDAAYSLLKKRERRDLHARVAERLEARIAEGRWAASKIEAWALCARHWERAAEGEEAVGQTSVCSPERLKAQERWLWAGEAALDEGRIATAVDYLSRAGTSSRARRRHAEGLIHLGMLEEARAEAKRALDGAAEGDEAAEARIVASTIAERVGDFRRALDEAGHAAAAARTEGARIRAAVKEGWALLRLARFADAMRKAEEAQSVARAAGDLRNVALCGSVIGSVHWSLGSYDAAIRAYEEALAIYRRRGDREFTANALNNIGVVQHVRGKAEEALRAHQEALALRREMGDRYGISASLNNCAAIFEDRGEYEAALKAYDEALTLSKQVGDRRGVGASLLGIANVRSARGEHDAALQTYEVALAMRRQSGEKFGVVVVLNAMGAAHAGAGARPRALKAHEEALALAREIGDRRGIADSLCGIGHLRREGGETGPAMRVYEESLAIRREIDDRTGVAWSLYGIGKTHLDAGAPPEAVRSALEESLDLARRIGIAELEVFDLEALAGAATVRGDRSAAAGFLRAALPLYERMGRAADLREARAKIERWTSPP